jgi:hypothetical protein
MVQFTEEEINKLKTRPSLKIIAPIDVGSGDIVFYEYVHQCKRLTDLEARILFQEYFYKYISWSGNSNIHHHKKYQKEGFILGDLEGFRFPNEGLYFESFLFCPYCGVDLTKDKDTTAHTIDQAKTMIDDQIELAKKKATKAYDDALRRQK